MRRSPGPKYRLCDFGEITDCFFESVRFSTIHLSRHYQETMAHPAICRPPKSDRFLDIGRSQLSESTTRDDSTIYILYRLRFVFSADSARAFDSFGGALAQSNNIGILWDRPIIESPAFAIFYDQHLRSKLSILTLGRTPSIDYRSLLSDGKCDIARYISNSIQSIGKSKRGKGKESLGEQKKWEDTEPHAVYRKWPFRAISRSFPIRRIGRWGY